MRRGQGAIEFVLITTVMLLLFTAAFIVAQQNYASIQEERFEQGVYNALGVVETELEVAFQAGEGYEREIYVPRTIAGIPFTLDLLLNQTPATADELSLTIRGQEYFSFLRVPVNGTILQGWHRVHGGDPVRIYNITRPKYCIGPDGTQIANLDDKTYYNVSVAPAGSSCDDYAEERVCYYGSLSGSYEHPSCEVEEYQNCELPDGATLEHGDSATYFEEETVPYGETCQEETLSCFNGDIIGDDETYTSPTCQEADPTSCTLPNDELLAHGETSDPFYTAENSGDGETCSELSATFTCNNGELEGANEDEYIHDTCYDSCTLPDGEPLLHGEDATYYEKEQAGANEVCSELSATFTCNNGELGGDADEDVHEVSTCYNSCTLPDGASLLHGESETYYSEQEVSYPDSCSEYAEVLSCEDGTILGDDDTHTHAQCVESEPSEIDYLSSSKTHQDCVNAGGEVVAISGDSDGTEVCRFDSSSCPSTWSQAANWTTTSSSPEPWTQNSYGSETYTCSGFTETIDAISYDTGTFSSGEHSWANEPVEDATCRVWGSTAWQTSCTDDPSITKVGASTISGSAHCTEQPSASWRIIWRNDDNDVLARIDRSRDATIRSVAEITQIGCY